MADYAGDVGVSETWKRLAEENDSLLIDVRTTAEWNFVGMPDLSSIGKSVILEEWQTYPSMQVNDSFAESVKRAVEDIGGGLQTELYFLCRSGVRSMAAASAVTGIGFDKCFNVKGGFEGPHNEEKHRGQIDGWKAKELPWIQN